LRRMVKQRRDGVVFEGRAVDERVIIEMKAEEAMLAAKLRAVRAFLDVYAPGPRMAVPGLGGIDLPHVPRRRPNEYAERIRGIAEEMVKDRAIPLPTREIVEELEKRGVEIRGKDKISAISALLSRSDTFQNIGRQGWLLSTAEYKGDGPHENGAAEAAPETGGVAAPSPVNQGTLYRAGTSD